MVLGKSKAKYGNTKVTIDGNTFDSRAEAEYYGMLKTMNKAGKLTLIELQPKIYLTDARILYKPDFLVEMEGKKFYIDVKGFSTPVFKIKARLWKHYGPCALKIVNKVGREFKIITEIIPIGVNKNG